MLLLFISPCWLSLFGHHNGTDVVDNNNTGRTKEGGQRVCMLFFWLLFLYFHLFFISLFFFCDDLFSDKGQDICTRAVVTTLDDTEWADGPNEYVFFYFLSCLLSSFILISLLLFQLSLFQLSIIAGGQDGTDQHERRWQCETGRDGGTGRRGSCFSF